MLKFPWLRLLPSGPGLTEDRALARYFRDEGLHAELEALHAQEAAARPAFERTLYAARSYFAA
jgi:hypothetical protein